MLILNEGMMLYHGSYIEVPVIDLERCAPGKDFGRGFYLTTDYDQARSFIGLSVKKNRQELNDPNIKGGYVSKYLLRCPQDLSSLTFPEPDAAWLHFVAANRRQDLFTDLIEDTASIDVVVGKIANDQTARTLQLYVTGAFGDPGTAEADDTAISLLLPNRLADQFCFRTLAAIGCLEFVESEYHEL